MGTALTPAEAILHRTGPNTITALFEADGAFDPARAFRGVQMLAEGSERFRAVLARGQFGAAGPVEWPRHVSLLSQPGVQAAQMMDIARCLRLAPERPLWRAVLVNPNGAGWSGIALQFDHSIADGTRMARHIVANVRPSVEDVADVGVLPHVTLADLFKDAATGLDPAPVGLCRVPFDALRFAVPEAISHGDGLLRLARRVMERQPEFSTVTARRKDHAAVAKIDTLNSGGRLGNHSRMDTLDLAKPSAVGEAALFRPQRTPLSERARMRAARLVPTPLLRRIVQAEFSRPGIVLTIVPVSRKAVALFGLPLTAIHPAAPALGRPLLAVTAVRLGDGFDVSVAAHGTDGRAVKGLSGRVAKAMEDALQ